eukprot:jgi/Chlat1/2175/Chrsp17S02853
MAGRLLGRRLGLAASAAAVRAAAAAAVNVPLHLSATCFRPLPSPPLLRRRVASACTTTNAVSDSAGTVADDVPASGPGGVNPLAPAPATGVELEAQTVLNSCWNRLLEREQYNSANINFPREFLFLHCAPGTGKELITNVVLASRGFVAKTVHCGELLWSSPSTHALMANHQPVPEPAVVSLLLEEILDPSHGGPTAGIAIEGFPRTPLQAEVVKQLFQRVRDYHLKHVDTPAEARFPRPMFRAAVLYLEEGESVRRQLARGRAVRDSGMGELWEEVPSDMSESAAQQRYQQFRRNYQAMLRLRHAFPFHFIDAMGSLADCKARIAQEMRYQSAFELSEATHAAIRHIPLSSDLVKHSRQRLVARLEDYCAKEADAFQHVVKIIHAEVLPILRKSALGGSAVYSTEAEFFKHNAHAADMLADILSERGFSVTWRKVHWDVPVKVNPFSYDIESEQHLAYIFRISFERPVIRVAETNDHLLHLPASEPAASGSGSA